MIFLPRVLSILSVSFDIAVFLGFNPYIAEHKIFEFNRCWISSAVWFLKSVNKCPNNAQPYFVGLFQAYNSSFSSHRVSSFPAFGQMVIL